jgi:hypothetical protein
MYNFLTLLYHQQNVMHYNALLDEHLELISVIGLIAVY